VSDDILHPHAGKVIVPGFGKERAVDYNGIALPDGTRVTLDEQRTADVEFWMAKRIGEHLVNVYPGRQWGVKVDLAQAQAQSGLVTITCPSLSQTKGYVIHIRNQTLAELKVRAARAAGEVLERYGVTRARGIDPDVIEKELPRNPLNDEVVSSDAEIVLPSGKRH
jgi:hypothetical protein